MNLVFSVDDETFTVHRVSYAADEFPLSGWAFQDASYPGATAMQVLASVLSRLNPDHVVRRPDGRYSATRFPDIRGARMA